MHLLTHHSLYPTPTHLINHTHHPPPLTHHQPLPYPSSPPLTPHPSPTHSSLITLNPIPITHSPDQPQRPPTTHSFITHHPLYPHLSPLYILAWSTTPKPPHPSHQHLLTPSPHHLINHTYHPHHLINPPPSSPLPPLTSSSPSPSSPRCRHCNYSISNCPGQLIPR